MARLQLSPATEQALQNLWKSTEKINPQGRQEEILHQVILRDLENLAKLRNERLLEGQSNLGGIIWGVLIIGALVSLLFSTLLGTESIFAEANSSCPGPLKMIRLT